MEKNKTILHKSFILKCFWQVVKRFKISFFITIIGTILGSGLDVYIPLQFLNLWNVLSTNDFTLVYKAQNIIILIFILGITRMILKRGSAFFDSYFQANVIAGLREQAFSYMIGHSHSFFSNNFGGSLTQKINKYAKSFGRLADSLFDNGIPLIVRSIGTVLAIYTLFPKYAYILIIFCIVFLTTALIYTRLKQKYDVLASYEDTKTTGAISDSIGNHSSIQLFSGQEYEKDKVGETIEKQKKATLLNWYLWVGLGTIETFYTTVVEFIIFSTAIGDWKLGLIGLPVMALIQTYLGRLLEVLWSFASIVRSFYDSFSDAEEMVMILDTPYDIKDTTLDLLKNIKGEIIINNATYIYDKNNTKVFDDFSLTIPAGQKIAIVGSSGAGKSTFVNLLMRLFDLTSGKILIDSVDISSISQKNLRDQISFVPQSPILFHRTLMENIRYGRRDATDEEVKRASSLAHCDDFIEKLPKGFDTYVGERGIKLSGGERQRVAIARAILKDAPILVLDEATSALDSESEMLIQKALNNLIKDKTTIVIAHRLSTVRSMDRIIVIEDGKIIEDDTHEQLINKDIGTYKKLWDLQAGGFEATI
jgi:ATP-binding cassette, subfamily B, bacterial